VEKPTFERIVEEQSGFIRRTLSQLGVCTRDLEDVYQGVLRGVDKGLAAFDPSLASTPENSVRSWLFGICSRQAASYRRTVRRRAEVLCEAEGLEICDGSPGAEERWIEAEQRALLAELLASTSADRRAVVVAYKIEETPMDEVARSLRIPVNTAWNRLRLGLRDLRAAWARRKHAQR
jgi:RNA polymerase sigma factor (sigma-70 family)